MNVKLVLDSTAAVIPSVREKCAVVPLTIHFGNEEYVDGVTISHHKFYEMLVESDTLPTTSQPTPDAFSQVFRQAVETGQEVVALTLSSKLSGTFQSAVIAADDFPGKVHVVDSKSAAIGTGILAELAVSMMEAGMSASSIAAALEKERKNVCVVAMLNTLEHLKRGGRISKTAAFAGELLSIKPVISLKDGEMVILGKARGSRQGNNLLVKMIQESGGVDFSRPVLLGYTGISDALLQKYIEDSAFLWKPGLTELHTTTVGSVIGTHAGPGAVAAAFFRKN